MRRKLSPALTALSLALAGMVGFAVCISTEFLTPGLIMLFFLGMIAACLISWKRIAWLAIALLIGAAARWFLIASLLQIIIPFPWLLLPALLPPVAWLIGAGIIAFFAWLIGLIRGNSAASASAD